MENPRAKAVAVILAGILPMIAGCQKTNPCTPCANIDGNNERTPDVICRDDVESDFADYQEALKAARSNLATIQLCNAPAPKPSP
ncbi:MAG: hypothetical protein ABII07_02410 [Patescibacteria group bacterium]|nr:hypothetical protein [Patescibacteria group bacterium]